MIHSLRNLTLESLKDEENKSEYLPQYVHPSSKGKQDLFGEWMDNIECLDAYVTNKATDMGISGEGMDYMDEDLLLLMLREEETHWKLLAIIEATIELKNWAWEGAAHPMEDFVEKIKKVEPITPVENIVSIPIKSIFASIIVPVKFVCNRIPIEFVFVEYVENSFPYNMIFYSAYLLALNVFISKISKETFNNKELKQGHVELIKEETQPVNLGTDDEPKMMQVGNSLTC